MKRPVRWSEDALADLAGEAAFIAHGDPRAARKVRARLDEVGAALGDRPTGRPGRVTGTYEKTVLGLRYVMAYALVPDPASDEEVVVIVRVIHTSRDWPSEDWPR